MVIMVCIGILAMNILKRKKNSSNVGKYRTMGTPGYLGVIC